jgi:hypothetical protein
MASLVFFVDALAVILSYYLLNRFSFYSNHGQREIEVETAVRYCDTFHYRPLLFLKISNNQTDYK